MNTMGDAWDMYIIKSFFHEETVTVMQEIPLSKIRGVDFVSWPYARFVIYIVRFAYNLGQTESFFTSLKVRLGVEAVMQ
jgi:hypothetical protein